MRMTAETSTRSTAPPFLLAQFALKRALAALMFAIFGVGALVLVVLVIPSARLVRSEAGDLVAQRWIRRAFAGFAWLMESVGLIGVEVHGEKRLARGPALVLANHHSLIDVVLLIAHLPQADCVVKAEAWENPWLRGIVSAAGYVPNREGPELVAECARRLREGRTLVLFPEGTRSPESGLRTFQRGAARIALASGAVIRPVHIACAPRMLGKDQPWWAIPAERVRYTLRVGADVPAGELTSEREPALAARRATEALQRIFESGARGDVA